MEGCGPTTVSVILTHSDRMIFTIERENLMISLQAFLLFIANVDVIITSRSISDGSGLPAACQAISWIILGL